MATTRSSYDRITAQRNTPGPIFKTADYTAKVSDRSIGVTPNSSADVTITLPAPQEFAKDDFITIWSNGNATNDVVVAANGAARNSSFGSTLTADGDIVTVGSDGENYIKVYEVAT